ncbi:hypothetical protein EVAR_12240_1 [Eumeta japonica]|uniref:Uncharacterized protein n=1 Tax=Eumeta variegata TaxID=151549 RepID=A0A4C1TU43_EUMVA|nr:hypothetical protein EVAR_12240_1 [Eumeta japonica]
MVLEVCPWVAITTYSLVAPLELQVSRGGSHHLLSGGSSGVTSVHGWRSPPTLWWLLWSYKCPGVAVTTYSLVAPLELQVSMGGDHHLLSGGSSGVKSVQGWLLWSYKCPWVAITTYSLVAPLKLQVSRGGSHHLLSGGSSGVTSVHGWRSPPTLWWLLWRYKCPGVAVTTYTLVAPMLVYPSTMS